MFLWSKNGKKSPAPAGGELAVQKVDRIEVVRNLVTRPPIYGGRRRKLRGGGGAGAPPLAPRVGGGNYAQQGEDIDRKSSEYIKKVRKMWFHSHKAAEPAAPRSPAA